MPFVSVMVPNYSHVVYFAQRIDSILRQTFQGFDVIILDDHSVDRSREVILNIESVGYLQYFLDRKQERK